MPTTVPDGFDMFLTWLTPTSTETQNAKSHRASIESCLKNNFGLRRFFRIGSFGNGTSVSGYSDVDYFASIPRDQLKLNSTTTLNQVQAALNARFPNTGVHVDQPTVVVPFGTDPSETTEIVPVDYMGEHATLKVKLYDMPDGMGGWKRTSPEAHNDYVDYVDDKLNGEVKPLIRFIKAWKFYRDVPISSFYLEMFTAVYAAKESSIIYSMDVRRVFDLLWQTQLGSVTDPMGISGSIAACTDETAKQDALTKLGRAVTRAVNARDAERADKISEAFDRWNKVYNNEFPGYY